MSWNFGRLGDPGGASSSASAATAAAGSQIAASASAAETPPGDTLASLYHNYPLFCALLAFAMAQLIKFFTT